MKPLGAGDRLGPYEILEAIGKGGMGEVYRARDPRMGREVAIKVSAEAFSERFSREVHAVAALNHPNVCTLYDVGPDYLVMELIEGPTLAERIKEGPVPLEEGLAIARQIGAALEAAHEKGIVHRDLKPGNVKCREDGTVKVLDFGLAKMGGTPTAQGEDSPTISMHATQAGVILGTASYMAPEQARGKNVDKRADIWAFGVVLHEMLTGRRLFQGEDLTETLASVVMKAPELDGVPRRVRPLLQSCLEKDPAKRLRDIGDAWRLLADEAEAPAVTVPLSSGRKWLWPAIAVLGMILAGGIATWAPWRQPPVPAELVQFEIFPPAGGSIQKFAVSPDGRKVAYYVAGGEQTGLWVRSLDNAVPVRIVESSGALTVPSFFWSADSRRVAFPGGSNLNQLMVVDSEGGRPEVLAAVDSLLAGGSWREDGTILFGSTAPSGVWRTSEAGGVPAQLTADERGAVGHFSPVLLPDGKHFLYLALYGSEEESGIFLGSIDAKPADQPHERILATTLAVNFVPGPDASFGYLLFHRDATLLAQKLDLRTFQLSGTPTRIATGVGSEIEFGDFSASHNGVLVYHATSSRSVDLLTLAWFDRDGRILSESAQAGGGQGGVALSPDGTRAAVGRTDPRTGSDVWVVNFSRNDALSRVTSGGGRHIEPVWSPDGTQVAYVSRGDKGAALARRSASGSGDEQVVVAADGKDRDLNDWSDDGRLLLFSEQSETTKSDLWVAPVDGGGRPEVVLNSAFSETAGQFSPDGQWIAYVSDETGQSGIYIQPFPPAAGAGEKIVVATDGAVMPRWQRDGRKLFYVVLRGGYTSVMAVDFTSSPPARVGIPKEMLRGPVVSSSSRFLTWDVAPSGDRFLLTALPDVKNGDTPLTVVLNWQRMLEE